jgi:hypothetical protein
MLGLDFGVSSVERSGLTLSGALYPALKGRGLARPNGSMPLENERKLLKNIVDS